MRAIRIILLCVIAAVFYGVIHDQITARICVEYFTIGHPRIIDSTSPTLLGLLWGVIATWWMGMLLGVPLALCATVGSWPKLDAAALARPIMRTLLVMACCAVAAGLIGSVLAQRGDVWLIGELASKVPQDRHAPFICALWAHLASYATGTLGGLALCAWAVWHRRKAAQKQLTPSDVDPTGR